MDESINKSEAESTENSNVEIEGETSEQMKCDDSQYLVFKCSCNIETSMIFI